MSLNTLFIQIPCLNEEESLSILISSLPREVAGFQSVRWVLLNDGSTDRSEAIARALGVDHVVSATPSVGLARIFQQGIAFAREQGADAVVTIDADGQYDPAGIKTLIEPIVSGRAGWVIGIRPLSKMGLSVWRLAMQRLGSRIVSLLLGVRIEDAVSGFRAHGKAAISALQISSGFTHSIEDLFQVRALGVVMTEVPIEARLTPRPSRLIRNLPVYLLMQGWTALRCWTQWCFGRCFR